MQIVEAEAGAQESATPLEVAEAADEYLVSNEEVVHSWEAKVSMI